MTIKVANWNELAVVVLLKRKALIPQSNFFLHKVSSKRETSFCWVSLPITTRRIASQNNSIPVSHFSKIHL